MDQLKGAGRFNEAWDTIYELGLGGSRRSGPWGADMNRGVLPPSWSSSWPWPLTPPARAATPRASAAIFRALPQGTTTEEIMEVSNSVRLGVDTCNATPPSCPNLVSRETT
jgi:hypothetical protein